MAAIQRVETAKADLVEAHKAFLAKRKRAAARNHILDGTGRQKLLDLLFTRQLKELKETLANQHDLDRAIKRMKRKGFALAVAQAKSYSYSQGSAKALSMFKEAISSLDSCQRTAWFEQFFADAATFCAVCFAISGLICYLMGRTWASAVACLMVTIALGKSLFD